ncbi:hypothetical protein [Natrinema sp. H-ect4]|uniref:hypothetical protein n=1 Tax=Natrinema sp. H-ect4 TaxID=3242699 RepID=UPI0035A99EC0
MAWTDFLDNQITYLLVFEAFVTFAVFGAYLGVFWMLGEIPQLSFSLEQFLSEYGVVFFAALVIVRAGNKVMNTAMRGM